MPAVETQSVTSVDAGLMRRVQAGEADAFEQLYERHAVRAFRVARSVIGDVQRAEDAVQEAFLKIWRGRANFRLETASFQAWAMSIVRNSAIDLMRHDAASKRPAMTKEGAETVEEGQPASLTDVVVGRDQAAALRESLARLPAAQAEAIGLAFFGELTHVEIAEELGLPAGTIKGRIRLGLEKLRVDMDRD